MTVDELRSFNRIFYNAKARDAADDAAMDASVRKPDITLSECCAIWNDCYTEQNGGKHPHMGKI